MMVIYVAGKYNENSHSGIDDNIRRAEHAMIILCLKGWAVICPHKNVSHLEIFEEVVPGVNWDFWLTRDLELLSRCDAILMLDNWENSKGAKREHDFATANNIPIFYQKDGYPSPSVLETKTEV